MSPKTRRNRHQKVKEIFSHLIELPLSERLEFLKIASQEDEDLFQEVQSLLEAHDEAEEFLEEVSAVNVIHNSINKDDKLVGQTIDKYLIKKEIGHGGMGIVFLAEREDFHQEVALKLIKRGMDSEAILERFAREREILAALNHPFVARLLDGGTTENDLPFFVMEYVEGIPIDKFCAEQDLDLEEKLLLFRKVCSAVQYAHQKLVVHRDLKPSNIIVTSDGTPKLLDFGIAKLLNAADSKETQTNQRVLTPAYASPEQMRGEAVDTTSDVYSLGKILSELIEIVGKETNKQKPNTQKHKPDTDLQAILQTSLREETTRRYGSVEKFSDDIRCYLAGLPISAQKDTFSYRARKFVERNYIAVTVAGLFLLTLLIGLVVVIWEDRKVQREHLKAEQRFNDVRKLAHSFMFDYHDAIASLSGSTSVREKLVKDALEYLDNLSREANEDVSLQLELATAYLKVGDVQGRPYSPNLGDDNGAMASYRKAQEILQKLSGNNPQNIDFKYNLATANERIGNLYLRKGNWKEAFENNKKALDRREEILLTDPNNAGYNSDLAHSYLFVGDAIQADCADLECLNRALESQRKSLQITQALVQVNPNDSDLLRDEARAFTRVGFRLNTLGLLSKDNQYLAQALENEQNSLAIRGKLAVGNPQNAIDQRNLADQFMLTADAESALDKTNVAIDEYNRSLKMFKDLSAADPSNIEALRDLSFVYQKMAAAFAKTNNVSEAKKDYQEVINIVQKLQKQNSANYEDLQSLMFVYQKLSEISEKTGNFPEAISIYNNVLNVIEDISKISLDNSPQQGELLNCYVKLGRLYTKYVASTNLKPNQKAENCRTAKSYYQKSLEIAEQLVKKNPKMVNRDFNDTIMSEIGKCDDVLKVK